MSKITILLQKMKSLCDSNNGKDTFNSPVTAKEISDWEIAHNVKLCNELKEFYLFSNGMNYVSISQHSTFVRLKKSPLEKMAYLDMENLKAI